VEKERSQVSFPLGNGNWGPESLVRKPRKRQTTRRMTETLFCRKNMDFPKKTYETLEKEKDRLVGTKEDDDLSKKGPWPCIRRKGWGKFGKVELGQDRPSLRGGPRAPRAGDNQQKEKARCSRRNDVFNREPQGNADQSRYKSRGLPTQKKKKQSSVRATA